MATDTFEDGDYTSDPTWSAVTTGGTIVVGADGAKNGSNGVRMTTQGDDDGANVTLSLAETTDDKNIWAYVRVSDVSDCDIYYMVAFSVTGVTAAIRINDGAFKYRNGAIWSNFTATPANDTWYRLRLNHTGSTGKVDYHIYQADGLTEIESHTNVDDRGTAIEDITLFVGDNAASAITVDWDDVSYSDTVEPVTPVQFLTGRKLW